jgi:hypothetical protein
MTADSESRLDAAAFLSFSSHEAAVGVLRSIGYESAHTTPSFSPPELVDESNKLLSDSEIVLMDMTTTVPETTEAAYKALTIAGFTAASACKKDCNAAFIIMRTQANTPSFLMGHHWSMVQALGKEVAEKHVKASPTPAAFVIFRDRQFYLPSKVCASNVSIAARLIARELTMDDKLFCCCICDDTFVQESTTACVNVSEIGVAECGHMFHRACVEHHVKDTGKYGCPGCENGSERTHKP